MSSESDHEPVDNTTEVEATYCARCGMQWPCTSYLADMAFGRLQDRGGGEDVTPK